MKKFRLDKVDYQVPTSWDEVTLKQQMQVSSDADNIKVEELKKMAVISGYCNIPIEVMRKTSMNKLNNLWKHLTFLNEKLPEKAIAEFNYKGDKYSIIEYLINNQFQDYVSLMTAQENHKDDLWNALPIMIAVLAKKEGETLDDFDLDERAKHFEDLPITIANRLKVFFYALKTTSQLSSLLYSNRNQIVHQKVEECKDTLKKVDGKGLRFRWLRGILLWYLKYIERLWEKSSNLSPSNPLKVKWKKIYQRLIKMMRRGKGKLN